MLQTAHTAAMPVLDLGMLVANAQDEAVETLDLIVTGRIGDGQMNPASQGPDIWQVATTSRWIYVTDRAVLADLRASLPWSGRTLLRVEGQPFTDMAGNTSLLVSRVVPTPFLAGAGDLGEASLAALIAEAPDTAIDALIIVAHSVACEAGFIPDLDPEARTMTFANPDVRVTLLADEAGVSLTATRVQDGALLSRAEATTLGLVEIETILLTQRHRAA